MQELNENLPKWKTFLIMESSHLLRIMAYFVMKKVRPWNIFYFSVLIAWGTTLVPRHLKTREAVWTYLLHIYNVHLPLAFFSL